MEHVLPGTTSAVVPEVDAGRAKVVPSHPSEQMGNIHRRDRFHARGRPDVTPMLARNDQQVAPGGRWFTEKRDHSVVRMHDLLIVVTRDDVAEHAGLSSHRAMLTARASAVSEPDALATALAPLIAIGQEERPLATRQPVADDAAEDTLHSATRAEANGEATLGVLTRRS